MLNQLKQCGAFTLLILLICAQCHCLLSYTSELDERSGSSYEKLEDFGETTAKPLSSATTSRYIGLPKNSVDNRKGLPPAPSTLALTMPDKSSDIIFPNSTMTRAPQPIRNLNPAKPPKIPLRILKKISHESNVIQFFEKFVSNVQVKNVNGQKYIYNEQGMPIEAGFGGPGTPELSPTGKPLVIKPFTGFSLNDRNNVNKPQAMANAERIGSKITKAALCEPELRTVEVPKPSDPNVIQFPRCVRIERCGGCCGSELLTCEALKKRATEVQVQKFAYNDESEKLEYTGTELVTLEAHEECRCNCRVKAQDCSEKHTYSSEDCLCTCKNRGEQEVCLRQSHKLWDPNLCQCVCREIKACSSGMSFNLETCECSVAPDPKLPAKVRDPNRRRRRTEKRSAERKRHAKRGL